MNKLGFYIESTQHLGSSVKQVRPPTLLVHTSDLSYYKQLRKDQPDVFIVGRLYLRTSEQDAYLAGRDPANHGAPLGSPRAAGRALGQRIVHLPDDWVGATEGGRPVIDAWMCLNECPDGPNSRAYKQALLKASSGQPADQKDREEMEARWRALDEFQVGFLEGLRQDRTHPGVLHPEREAVAFNFGTGNYSEPEHYLQWFPRTLESYTYLGFHEYGWPTLDPAKTNRTSAGLYRRCMAGKDLAGNVVARGIRDVYGNRHQAIITELGLARGSGCPDGCRHPVHGCDQGWAYRCAGEPPVTQQDYFRALEWYNRLLVEDREFVKGACLFEVGHTGEWETFRHRGTDPEGKPIQIIDWIKAHLVEGKDSTDLA